MRFGLGEAKAPTLPSLSADTRSSSSYKPQSISKDALESPGLTVAGISRTQPPGGESGSGQLSTLTPVPPDPRHHRRETNHGQLWLRGMAPSPRRPWPGAPGRRLAQRRRGNDDDVARRGQQTRNPRAKLGVLQPQGVPSPLRSVGSHRGPHPRSPETMRKFDSARTWTRGRDHADTRGDYPGGCTIASPKGR